MIERFRFRSPMLRTLGMFVALFLLAATSASAEVELLTNRSANPWAGLLPTSSRLSLLDLSKLDVSHQLVFSYGSDSAGKSDMGGLWLTKFHYPLSGPLTLDLSVGSSLSHSAVRGFQADKLFLEKFSLQYRPNDSLFFHLMYRQIPSRYLYFPSDPRY